MPISISKLPEVTNVKDNSFMLITQDGTTKRTMCDQFVTEEEARLDEFSPTVIVGKSMSKTGEGDNIDYSSSVYDAPMKDVILKGKTMVNCIQEPSSQDVVLPYEFEDGQYVTINDTKESGALGVELKGQTLVNLLGEIAVDLNRIAWSEDENNYNLNLAAGNGQPTLSFRTLYTLPANKTYTLFINMTSYTTGLIHIDFRTPSNTSSSSNQYYFGETGWKKLVFTTTDETGFVRMFNRGGVDNTFSISKSLILLEGDHTNTPIPNYFTGMASCKMPILCTVGKNLFDTSNQQLGYYWSSENTYTAHAGSYISDSYVKVQSGQKLRANNVDNSVQYMEFDKNKNFIQRVNISAKNTYTVPNNVAYLRLSFYNCGEGFQCQVEQGTTSTVYEDHKSSILSLPEEVVLRSLPNGVCDTFNTRTGIYTQRIEEIIFDGEIRLFEKDCEDIEYYRVATDTINNFKLNSCTVNNMLPVAKMVTSSTTGEFVGDHVNSHCIHMRLLSSKLSQRSVSGVQEYLQSNPITVQYELATPIVTKINLPSTLKSWNTTTHIYSEIPENTLYPTLSHSNPTYPVILKQSTKYSIVANSYSNDHTNSAINFNLGGATASTTVGNRVTTITTPSTLSNELLTMSGRGNKLNNVMVIEGDVAGDEPYFEGICDCKSPILSNVGKNLVNPNNYINYPNNNISVKKDGEHSYILENKTTGNWRYQIGDKVKLKANTTYTLSYDYELLSESVPMNYGAVINLRDESNPNKNISGDAVKGKPRTFTTTEDVVVQLAMYITDTSGGINKIKYYNIQVVEAPTVLDYEPYKSNTTTFEQKDDKTIVLRSLPDGTCDTLNVETGEYVQRIGANFVSGEVIESINDWGNDNNKRYCYIRISKKDLIAPNRKNNGANYKNLICDKLPTTNSITVNGSFSITHNSATSLIFCFAKDYTTCDEQVAEVKRWAKSNGGFTIQYELETPIVRKVDLSGFPYAYKDGHVILSSGSIEQSLTPKIEYNIATNRGGQITQNTKSLIRQGKLLDDIEDKINQIIEATINDSIMLMKLRNK